MPPRTMNPRARKLNFKESRTIFSRILKMMVRRYPGLLVLAIICILISSAAGVLGNVFIGDVLIDQFILPMLASQPTALYGMPMNLQTAIIIMAGIYFLGILSA